MFTLIWLAGPALAGALLAASTGFRWRRVRLLMVAGLVLALALVLVVYLRSPLDYAHDRSGCSDCGEYLGRWWEPALVVFIAAVGYLCWIIGVTIGVMIRAGASRVASRHRRRVASSATRSLS